MIHNSNEQLVGEYLSGDDSAFDILLKRNLPAVYNFVAQLVGHGPEAEDVAQEVFVKVWKNLRKFDANKKFKSWLFQIARNTAIDHLRARKFTVDLSNKNDDEDETDGMEMIVDAASTATENITTAENAAIIQKAVQALPEKYRTVLMLYYFEELSLPEIAAVFKESTDTIKSRHRRALIKLRAMVKKTDF